MINFISFSSYAESIKDIEIEGISVGESALKYFDKNLIENSSHDIPRTDNKYRYASIYDGRFRDIPEYSGYQNLAKFNYEVYDVIEINYLKDDKDFIIYGVAGSLSKNFGKRFTSEKECIALKEKIFDEIKPLYPNAKVLRKDTPAPVDPTGKSKAYRTALGINPKAKWFEVEIACIYYKGKYAKEFESSAGVIVKTEDYNNWINKQALVK